MVLVVGVAVICEVVEVPRKRAGALTRPHSDRRDLWRQALVEPELFNKVRRLLLLVHRRLAIEARELGSAHSDRVDLRLKRLRRWVAGVHLLCPIEPIGGGIDGPKQLFDGHGVDDALEVDVAVGDKGGELGVEVLDLAEGRWRWAHCVEAAGRGVPSERYGLDRDDCGVRSSTPCFGSSAQLRYQLRGFNHRMH